MNKFLFNQNWKFKKIGNEEVKEICLPHDAMIYEKRNPNALSGDAAAFFEVGKYIYEKQVGIDAKYAYLEFDGVYKDCKIYLNNELKKEHAYGYSPFVVQLGSIKNDDVIKVECGIENEPESRWYPGAGIYRDVMLYTSDCNKHILVNGIKVSTIDYEKGIVNVKTSVTSGYVDITISFNSKEVVNAKGNDVDIIIPDVKLWDENNPNLYEIKAEIIEDGKVVDSYTDSFGVRKIEKRNDGLYLNGKKILLKGGCVHHDNGLLGSATYKTSEYRRVKILKKAGFNAIRSAHNPASKHLLDACDELGIYVMDETWDMWFHKKNTFDYGGKTWRENYREDIKEIVERDFNHPSVILYSIGNEVSEPAKQEGIEKTKEMIDLFHQFDPNRLVTGGFNLMIIASASIIKNSNDKGKQTENDSNQKQMNSTIFNMITSIASSAMNKAVKSKKVDMACTPSLDLLDIAGYNYGSGRYKLDMKKHPHRLIVGSETMPYDLAKNWKMVEAQDNLCGDFMWTAWDYIGECGVGSWTYEKAGAGFKKSYPYWLADTGAFDIIGTPNAEAAWAMATWHTTDRPIITIQPINHDSKLYKATWRGTNGIPSYSWRNCEGRKGICEVFFDCAKIELYQNNKKIAAAKVKENRAIFKIKYVPGILEAIAYDSKGIEIARNILQSANSNSSVKVLPEVNEISNDELLYVNIIIADDNGIVESNNDQKIKVEVENGKLLAFGSGNPCTEDDIHSDTYSTYYGRALAIIKPINKEKIIIKANNVISKVDVI